MQALDENLRPQVLDQHRIVGVSVGSITSSESII